MEIELSRESLRTESSLPEPPRMRVLPAMDRVRAGLETPARRRAPIWMLVLAAAFAAAMGVSAAAAMIFGPGGPPSDSKTAVFAPR
jgi:hypothetical protein